MWNSGRWKMKREGEKYYTTISEDNPMTMTAAELIQAGQDAAEAAVRAAEARQYNPMPNPFNAPESYEVDAQILIYCGLDPEPSVVLPFWSDHVNGDVRERVLEVAKQMAAAYAYAAEWDVTVQVIINHRMAAL